MTVLFIKAKLKKSYGQTNIDKYMVTAHKILKKRDINQESAQILNLKTSFNHIWSLIPYYINLYRVQNYQNKSNKAIISFCLTVLEVVQCFRNQHSEFLIDRTIQIMIRAPLYGGHSDPTCNQKDNQE